MTPIIENAIKSLSNVVNVSTGLGHPNDMNKARALFALLHAKGEILLKSEIAGLATRNRWNPEDADELGSLAQQIGDGKTVNPHGLRVALGGRQISMRNCQRSNWPRAPS